MSPPTTTAVQWLLDTRDLWPGAVETRQLTTVASRALALLTEAERAGVLRFFRARDARMALGSHLLKHLAVARLAGAPWRRTATRRDAKGKPVFVADAARGEAPVAFNVSHQAGLVVLVAVATAVDDEGVEGGKVDVDVGVDLVCPAERRERDRQLILAPSSSSSAIGGWVGFVDMHADVFAPGEAAYLKYQILGMPFAPRGGGSSGGGTQGAVAQLDFRLRCFYTLWCLREAYLKMAGDALLAEWINALEFRNFRPPPLPLSVSESSGSTDREEEEEKRRDDLAQDEASTVRTHEIWFRGRRVADEDDYAAALSMRSLGSDYMVCTAVRVRGDPAATRALADSLGPFELLDLDEVLDAAEALDTEDGGEAWR